MKRWHYVGMALALVAGAGIWWWGQRDPDLHDPRWGPITPADLGQKTEPTPPAPLGPPRLAIGALGLANESQDRALGDLLLAELASVKGLQLVERQELDRALREIRLSLGGLADPTQAREIGHMVGANLFLLGSPTRAGRDPAALVRLIDARTGILRDVTVLSRPQADLPGAAGALAAFVREVLSGTNATGRVYLAVGSFQNLSLNGRLADFPERLRAALTAAYQDGPVTLLEREAVSTLLEEQRLALAGLANDGRTPPPMQAAMWLVDGMYQGFADEDNAVDLVVRVQRIRGPGYHAQFRGPVDQALFAKVKRAIDASLEKGRDFRLPANLKAEVAAHLMEGKRLAGLTNEGRVGMFWRDGATRFWGHTEDYESDRERQQMESAIQEFEAALLLEPDSNDARMLLATCLADPRVGRLEEARGYLLEIIGSPRKRPLGTDARLALALSYRYRDDHRALELLRRYRPDIANPADLFCLRLQERFILREQRARGEITPEEYLPAAVDELFEALRRKQDQALKLDAYGQFGENFLSGVFGPDGRAKRLAALNDLLPRLKAEFPHLKPFILATVVSLQTDTNAPVVAEFIANLEECAANPAAVVGAKSYFGFDLNGPYNWAFKHKMYNLMLRIGRAREAAVAAGKVGPPNDRFRALLGLAHIYQGNFQAGLDVFEPYEQRLLMIGSGPWGSYKDPFYPLSCVRYCRDKLGLPPNAVMRKRFNAAEDHPLSTTEPFVFASAGKEAFLVQPRKLIRLDLAQMKAVGEVRLPGPPFLTDERFLTCIAVSPGAVWIGTDGQGLWEVDRKTWKVKRWTTAGDGLTLNYIGALHVAEGRLWIGFARDSDYGTTKDGGLGVLDLASRKFRAFNPKLRAEDAKTMGTASAVSLDRPDGPPRKPVKAIAVRGDEVWLAVKGKGIQRLRISTGEWTTYQVPDIEKPMSSLDADDRRVIAGARASGHIGTGHPHQGGVSILDRGATEWRYFNREQGLPLDNVTGVACDGDRIWVGGTGFVAIVDAKSLEVLRFADVRGEPHHLSVANGVVWLGVSTNLYRIDPAKLGL